MGDSEASAELSRYQPVLEDRQHVSGSKGPNLFDPAVEELRMAPLVWWEVKKHFEPNQKVERGYGVLGHVPNDKISPESVALAQNNATRTPILLNTDTPWSAFLCGSQGSGKSHSLSCMLENCLLEDKTILPRIGYNPNPLAGLVFHYDRCQGSGVCEAAYLCTNIKTTVLIIIMLLREMALESQGRGSFSYTVFKSKLTETRFARGQDGPMKLRLDLLESFMKRSANGNVLANTTENDFLIGKPGTLTIVDLTDPVIDPESACALFDICLSVFIQQTQCGKIVALDEAHNYMTEDGNSAKAFTEKLLRTVREQRHQAVRVVVATQEPSINPQLLDLCSITMVHRCTSPEWFKVLKQHIAALYLNSLISATHGGVYNGTEEATRDDKALFNEIVRLKLGESLLFCPTAAVKVAGEGIGRMEGSYVKFKTRQRVTADGGKSKLAAERVKADGEA
ncbi:hypothetical protein P171DRAFT_450876 [Karstenula rhodostoma CBS 690.94]|uniref:AAA+ ATPase domain-containing protein n=1 Tax=Karstenula rhodostoma CBS 690.94 TaxID=1392251 RepID=A0A9P4UID4_9PLEO|nr:hypothetical protein P171DRAFT_450876 [Karstenula rhodostoma CBS 690.94]